MTLNNLEQRMSPYFVIFLRNWIACWPITSQWLKIDLMWSTKETFRRSHHSKLAQMSHNSHVIWRPWLATDSCGPCRRLYVIRVWRILRVTGPQHLRNDERLIIWLQQSQGQVLRVVSTVVSALLRVTIGFISPSRATLNSSATSSSKSTNIIIIIIIIISSSSSSSSISISCVITPTTVPTRTALSHQHKAKRGVIVGSHRE